MYDIGVCDQVAGNIAGAIAESHFLSGYYCAESVLMALAESNGRESGGLSRLVSGLCGGMSRSGGSCGALTGGMVAMGLLFGRENADSDKTMVYTLGYHLSQAFEKEFGSTLCREVAGVDLATEEGSLEFQKQDLGNSRCRLVTARAAAIAQELINSRHSLQHPLI